MMTFFYKIFKEKISKKDLKIIFTMPPKRPEKAMTQKNLVAKYFQGGYYVEDSPRVWKQIPEGEVANQDEDDVVEYRGKCTLCAQQGKSYTCVSSYAGKDVVHTFGTNAKCSLEHLPPQLPKYH